jgi:hypothetical protein
LVSVHIHQFQPGGAVVDAAALAQFQEQWATYRKLVESDCLAHRKVGGILRETLNDTFTSPFCFLDIAGGDASTMKSALRGTQVRHYQASICRKQPLSSLPPISPRYPSRSISTTAISWRPCCAGPSMAMRPGAALSIHHLSTQDKLRFMKTIRTATGARAYSTSRLSGTTKIAPLFSTASCEPTNLCGEWSSFV